MFAPPVPVSQPSQQEPAHTTGDHYDDRPLRQRSLTIVEWREYAVSALVGTHLALLLRTLFDWDDLLGSAIVAYLGFFLVLYVIVSARSRRDLAIDCLMTTAVWTAGFTVVSLLGWAMVFVIVKGLPLLRPAFLTNDLSTVGALDKGGGVLHSIVGTAEQVGIATVVVVPVSILTAVYLNEIKGRFAPIVRFFTDALSGLPSIVCGLLVLTITGQFRGLHAGYALMILAIPIVTRASEEILRTIGDPLREAGLALGAPQWRVVGRIVLPTARAGLLTAVILGVARMVGETAPVLLTASTATTTNWNPLGGVQASLSTTIWDLSRQPNKTQIARAWAAALVLMLLVLILFAVARYISARGQKKLGRR
jgi:phosphate transport system permease protein